MTFSYISPFKIIRLKYAVNLRRLRAEGGDGRNRYIGLENIESKTGRLLLEDNAGDQQALTVSVGEYFGSLFLHGDVLFGKLRPYLAKAWLAEFDGYCSTEFLVFEPHCFEARFLLYVLLSRQFIDPVDSATFGSKMPRADWDFIGNMPVPLPQSTAQRAIATYLDRETARIDALVAAKERWLELLAEKRRAIISQAVTRGLNPNAPMRDSGVPWLGEVPTHWALCHLKRALTSMDYGISESVDVVGNIAVLRMGDIQGGEISYSKVGFVESVDDSLLLHPGDLVFNRTNSLDQVGKVALYRGGKEYSVSFASYLVRLRCSPKVIPEYLNWLLNSVSFLAWGRSEALPAIGQANLNPNRYGYLPTVIPPLSEQKRIVDYVRETVKRLDVLRVITQKSITFLKERRAALISAAVTGQIDVSNENTKEGIPHGTR
ncbi:MAG: restriction endonuclease subunit S [Magnetococcales bacterium]|nr:restriction endonuclease subunit S [Magnetococcales bacterium]MBF0114045.1 restriction endonuclease subunit S [Magnetococcales bacterium]